VKPAVKIEQVSPIEVGAEDSQADIEAYVMWIKKHSITLYDEHKEMILNGSKLNDMVINAAQLMLKDQFGLAVNLTAIETATQVSE